MVSPRLALSLLLTACEADVFNAATSPVDDAGPPPSQDAAIVAPADDASEPSKADAAPTPPACDASKPFGAPQAVSGLGNGLYKEGARLSAQQTTMFFASNSTGVIELYEATRPDGSAPFGNVVPVPGMPSSLPSFAPSLSSDALTMVYGQQQLNGEMHLAMATRADASAAFDAPVQLASLNGVNSTAEPYLRADGQVVYFVSNRVDPKALHLYRANKNGTGFDPPTRVSEIAMTGGERYPAVTSDDLVLFFSTFTNTQKGGADVWVSHRASTADPFGPPVIVPELSSSQDDDVTWISPDTCVAYVRRGDASVGSIFVARK